MNKNVVLAVAKRDLRSWFGNPTGYVFILLFVAVSCGVMMWSATFFTNSLANLDTWSEAFPWIALVFVAAATMGVWTSERANGTQELLFTLPARDADLLLGKLLAYVGVYTLSLLFTIALPLALTWLGSPDWGQLFANYVGYWLLGVMLVSVGMLGSQLTHNPAVAFILSLLFGAAVLYLGWLLGWLGFSSWLVHGPLAQFGEFARGMIPLAGVLLFVGLTATFFYLNLALLSRRHWRGGAEGAHRGVRVTAMAVATLSLTVIGVYAFPRFDATFEGIHSLGEESKKLLASLDPAKPVTITVYVSDDVPEQVVQQRRLLLNLVDQFDALGGSAVEKRIVIPAAYSDEASAAERDFGIRPVTMVSPVPGGGMREMAVFLGFAVSSGTEDVVTPFVEPGVPLEYELTRSIRVASNAKRQKVGVLKTDVELAGGFDFQTFRQKPRWQIADELQQQYKLENVDSDKDYPEDLACLVVPQPSSLLQEQMDRLKAWILAGNPTLLLEDPAPLGAWGTSIDDPKGGQRNMMMGGGGPQKGDYAGLLAAIGLSVPRGDVVWDLSGRSFPGGRIPEEFLFVREAGMPTPSPITSGLQSVVLLMPGHLQAQDKAGFTVTPLLTSPDPMRADDAGSPNGVVQKLELFQFDPFGGGPQINPYRRRERRNDEMVLAARVTSTAQGGAEKGVDVIYVADLDLVGNDFFQIRRQLTDANFRFDNVTFVMNCIDTLVGDESLIELRKRRPILRKLDRVEREQKEFEARWTEEKTEAEVAAKTALDKAQARLDEAVAKIRNDATLDEQAKEVKIVEVQTAENRSLEREKARIEADKKAKIERAAYERDVARKRIYDGFRVVTLGLAIVPALLLGILTLVRRSSRAASIVPPNRMVRGGGQ